MEGWLSIEDILLELSKKGYSFSRRTFLYYVQLGLIPKGRRRGQPSGGVKFFYPPTTLERLFKILELKQKGLRLKEIREVLGKEREEESGPPEEEIFSDIEALRRCTLCGICGGVCPVYEEMESPPWRLVQMYLMGPERATETNTPWICIGCYLCEERCPEEVPLVSFLNFLRRKSHEGLGPRISPAQEWSRLFWDLLVERGRSFDFGAVHAYQIRLLKEGAERKFSLKVPEGRGWRQVSPPQALKNIRIFRKMLSLAGGPSR